MTNSVIKWIAIGFGFGLSPIMPGTVGTLWGLPIAWGVMLLPTIWCQVGICLILSLIAVPSSKEAIH